MNCFRLFPLLLVLIGLTWQGSVSADPPDVLPGTDELKVEGDIASQLVAGVDRFLLRKLDESVDKRSGYWKRDCRSAEKYNASIAPNRTRLSDILGMRDPRVPFNGVEFVGTTERPSLVGRGDSYEVYMVRWPAFGDVHGEGLLMIPTQDDAVANVVAIPDADQTPEQVAGLVEGVAEESQFARRLAVSGCRVLVPTLISRDIEKRGRATLTHREFLYRSAFELGRHLIGYEAQKALAAVDWFRKDSGEDVPIGVFGYGEGGMLALYAAALDTRIDAACVSGYFGNRNSIWRQPIDRNVFGLLNRFGDAELASMVAPRTLIIEAAKAPEMTLPGKGGAPAVLTTPEVSVVREEVERARTLTEGLKDLSPIELVVSEDGRGPFGSGEVLAAFLRALAPDADWAERPGALECVAKIPDPEARLRRQIHEIDRHSQSVLRECYWTRQKFIWDKLDASSVDAYKKSIEPFRKMFREEVIGCFDRKPLAPNVRTRKVYDKETWTGYEVVMDVYPDVIAYGILLLPKGLEPDEKRPVVVCQHGLEGRPRDTIEGDSKAYHNFAARLCERGFITFAPQNLYIFGDRFRTLQRKANPLGKTLFSIITPQHRQIVGWLKTLPGADPDRIAFYGLSYGGKTAMRVPALVTDYCLSICSGDFNEWVDKNASTLNPRSYVWTGEYEIFEFDLGRTFNYAEMAALIAPRPFMVERGHHDGVADDWTVASEYAKVRYLYEAGLKLPDRTAIEWFNGPHTINGQGTFDFLHRHLDWPKP